MPGAGELLQREIQSRTVLHKRKPGFLPALVD